MKQLFTILAFGLLTTTFGQTAAEYLKSGVEKHNAKDFAGAITEYTKAIKADKNLRDAYYNRGVCELGLKDLKSAKNDFDKTIELDPNFPKAYYNRATIYASEDKYLDALPDLDKTIELEQAFPNALVMRGQIKAQFGNNNGACEDFHRAKGFGDKNSEKLLNTICGNKQQNGESFVLHWPENENWKVGNNRENDIMRMIELIHTNETSENWTEIGTCTCYKNVKNVPCDASMKMMYEQSKKKSPQAKLTLIEKDEKAEYPWIIFTIESPSFSDNNKPESQLWYIIQGKTSLYANFRAVKKASIPTELKQKWISFFKSGKMTYQ